MKIVPFSLKSPNKLLYFSLNQRLTLKAIVVVWIDQLNDTISMLKFIFILNAIVLVYSLPRKKFGTFHWSDKENILASKVSEGRTLTVSYNFVYISSLLGEMVYLFRKMSNFTRQN